MSQLAELKSRLAAHPQLQAAQGWYRALPARDQLIVKAVAGFVGLCLVYLMVFAPLLQGNASAQKGLQKNLELYNLIASNADKFGGRTVTAASGPILPMISQSARQDNIKLDRYEQDGKGVRIWLDHIEFDRFIAWVESLQVRHGIRVSQITVDSNDAPGWVDVRATLTAE
ncbi:type II secretion system protein GspM [Oceanobacter mangrovi]|uniref:type II secretion system protein GspM n=1 Tax=Oceanobacter mangrovi TaxID=2862510 RepID=UPI001C8E3287|nr:type II secretion system protein M [Oceanobacter mangrovi]